MSSEEQNRAAVLEQYGVLTQPTSDLQALVDLVAQVCDAPNAAINIITHDQQRQIATTGIDPSVCSRDDSMCAAVMSVAEAVVVSDASLDERFSTNAFVTGDIGNVRFYASAPLTTPDGSTLGRLCVFDDEIRTLTPEQEHALVTIAGQIMEVFELRYRTGQLETSLTELARLRDELRRSNRHLTHFAGQVSHDLRSPLTAILANAELLAGEPAVEGDPDLTSLVDAVNAAGLRMNRMIEEILGFASEGGRVELAETDLGQVLDLVLSDLAPLVQQKGATVERASLPRVTADADLLYSVLLNLLSNALKFTREDVPPVITVTAERGDARWRVIVSDNGIGIPEERRQAVFALHVREETGREGHGIGLATTRRLVQAHQGEVGVEESAAGGTAVWFELPD
jgi:signal transduction histidine kinase